MQNKTDQEKIELLVKYLKKKAENIQVSNEDRMKMEYNLSLENSNFSESSEELDQDELDQEELDQEENVEQNNNENRSGFQISPRVLKEMYEMEANGII